MDAGAAAIHRVDASTASLMDRVDDDVFDHPVRPEWLAAVLVDPAHLLVVAVADGVVVGMASGICQRHPDKPPALFINEVGVAGRWRRQGLGRRLVSEMLAQGRERGCTEAWVATEVGNGPARALYASLGGVPDDEPAIVYAFPLAASTGTAPHDP